MNRALGFFAPFFFSAAFLGFSADAASVNPGPAPSAQLDMSFPLLPAHGLEPIPEPSSEAAAASPSDKEKSYRVGDQIALRASPIDVPAGSNGPLSATLPPGTQPLNEEGWEVFPKKDNGKGGPNELRIIAVPLKPGKLTLPSLAIQDASGKSIARTHPWSADVVSAISKNDPKPQEAVDLKPPAELAFPWWAIASFAFGALVVLGALAYWIYRWSKRRRPMPQKPAEPPKPEDELALLALAELEKSGALARGEFKKHYFRVSEILKSYVGARYGFDAPECTTREIFENLKLAWGRELGGQENLLPGLRELFAQLDRVKFTDHVPDPLEAKQVADTAREFIKATRRQPVVLGPDPTGIGGRSASR